MHNTCVGEWLEERQEEEWLEEREEEELLEEREVYIEPTYAPSA